VRVCTSGDGGFSTPLRGESDADGDESMLSTIARRGGGVRCCAHARASRLWEAEGEGESGFRVTGPSPPAWNDRGELSLVAGLFLPSPMWCNA
jgi:hypothetical protein